MNNTDWTLIATTDSQSHVAQTTVNEPDLIYRAASKWIIRGGASKILRAFWEYIDQYDNEIEDSLLDQLLTQAETQLKILRLQMFVPEITLLT